MSTHLSISNSCFNFLSISLYQRNMGWTGEFAKNLPTWNVPLTDLQCASGTIVSLFSFETPYRTPLFRSLLLAHCFNLTLLWNAILILPYLTWIDNSKQTGGICCVSDWGSSGTAFLSDLADNLHPVSSPSCVVDFSRLGKRFPDLLWAWVPTFSLDLQSAYTTCAAVWVKWGLWSPHPWGTSKHDQTSKAFIGWVF